MKVLWFTNIPMPEMVGSRARDHATSGGWMMALLEQLAAVPNMDISVACAALGLPQTDVKVAENVRLYPISQGRMWRKFCPGEPDNNPVHLDACVRIARKVNPDLIHIHGSERFYGLLGARELLSAPIVISLQGLVHEYAKYRQFFGVTPLKDIITFHRPFHLPEDIGRILQYLEFRRSAKRELTILRGNRWFMGRTLWDHAHLKAVNPQARYFHVPELLRPSFYGCHWNIASCQRHRIIFSNANSFRRGTETLLHAVSILKEDFPDISLALAGGVERLSYGKRLQRRIAGLGLSDAVEFLGRINEVRMAGELCKSHVFAITSLAENSPNSLCEAQLVGMPCVASYVGGIPSLVDEGETGMLFPAGDAAVLAERLREIFVSDDLARKLGALARETALCRHDPESVTRTVLETYETIIAEAEGQPKKHA